jgi:hypothetical protein
MLFRLRLYKYAAPTALKTESGRGARSLAMTEIKLGRIPHSALAIPRLNGNFLNSFWDGQLGQTVFEFLM